VAIPAYRHGYPTQEGVIRGIAVIVVLAAFAAAPTRADFDAGVALYVSGDYAAAYREFLESAADGHPGAQYNLGLMLTKGVGVDADVEQAVHWWRRAAESGHVSAQYNLGQVIDSGTILNTDPSEAAKWFRRAAEQGHAAAQNNLALKYETGIGLPHNPVFVAMWFQIAARAGNAVATDNLGTLTGEMAPEDVDRANELARFCGDNLAACPK
jgi:TPR repeat protein